MTYRVENRPVVPKQILDGMLQGNFLDTGEKVWAMNKFGNSASAGTFRECDIAMHEIEVKTFDRDESIREFIATHTAGTPYPVADYWHWIRRFGGGCVDGREQFLHAIEVDFADERTPEWFLDLIYKNAPPPFNDPVGIISELLKSYGLEAAT